MSGMHYGTLSKELPCGQHEPAAAGARRRKSSVVALLSFLWSGLGHIYIGRARRGLFLFSAEILLSALFLSSGMAFSLKGLLSGLGLLLAYKVFVIADSVLLNRKRGSFRLRPYNRFAVYAGFVALATVLSTTTQFTTSRIEAFKIPSLSMVPTFLIGDHIMVDKWAYRKNGPQRGDLVVFRYPRDPELDFIKRCVAVEGDTLEIRDKVLLIDSKAASEPYAFFNSESPSSGLMDNFGPFIVPGGSVFVLGDNRDNSNDSRLFGEVAVEDIKGKVRLIYWSWDRVHRTVRWDRIGRKHD